MPRHPITRPGSHTKGNRNKGPSAKSVAHSKRVSKKARAAPSPNKMQTEVKRG